MRNYNQEIEAAYMQSRRQGDQMRNLDRERGSHENRKNRYLGAIQQHSKRMGYTELEPVRRISDSYRPADSGYMQVLEPVESKNNSGMGPRNYKRSDDRIKEIICDAFCDDPHLDATNVDVEVKNSEVVLSGSVDDRFAKRLAEDIAEDVAGVTHVENRIRVNQN